MLLKLCLTAHILKHGNQFMYSAVLWIAIFLILLKDTVLILKAVL